MHIASQKVHVSVGGTQILAYDNITSLLEYVKSHSTSPKKGHMKVDL